jgi:hypothetical protein
VTVTYEDLQPLEGKKVELVRRAKDSDGNEINAMIEGRLDAVATVAVMLKPRGRQAADIIPLDEIVSVEAVAGAARKVQQKLLKPVDIDSARAHLADRHGLTLTEVNALPPQGALELHEKMDHTDLGHRHGVKSDEDEADAEGDE